MKDFIIVGFGLAGLHMAHELQKRKRSFVTIDQGRFNASKVAGGVINPLILKRFTKVWMADTFIPTAVEQYRQLESLLQGSYVSSVPIYRKIKSVREQNDWFTASEKLSAKPYMNDDLKTLLPLPNSFKYGEVKQSYVVDLPHLIRCFKSFLKNNNQFFEEKFDYQKLSLKKNIVSYNAIEAKHIIFCEGVGLKRNPFFNRLPLIGNKGEYLIVEIPGLKLNQIIKTSLALIPLGNNRYKFGASYELDFNNWTSDEKAKNFLIGKLEELITQPYTIIDVQVGVRPTVRDRRPLLGQHPEFKNMFLFNGLGTHGVMTAPTAAQWLVKFIIENQNLPKEVDIQRYYTRKNHHLL